MFDEFYETDENRCMRSINQSFHGLVELIKTADKVIVENIEIAKGFDGKEELVIKDIGKLSMAYKMISESKLLIKAIEALDELNEIMSCYGKQDRLSHKIVRYEKHLKAMKQLLLSTLGIFPSEVKENVENLKQKQAEMLRL